jgi:hypothetical protein
MKKVESQNPYGWYWAGAMILFILMGISTTWYYIGSFWNGYMLDICGAAWNYILIRGLFTERKDNLWTRFFTPVRTYLLIIFVSFGIETLQYFEVYDSTFDPYDLLAYVSLLSIVFVLDMISRKKVTK